MSKTGAKGFRLEELLRAYFLRAGMYVVRGAPLQLESEDLTDIDLWLYERPTGSSRRRQIIDAKSKTKPKAIERLFWTKGLFDLLKVDGAYVATTDTRPLLKEIAQKLGISVLDGSDLKRIAESEKVWFADRLNEEEIDELIKTTDKNRKNKNLQTNFIDLKSALIDNFGAGTVNRSLEHFSSFSHDYLVSHPNSQPSEICLRLVYFAASIVAISLDFALAKIPFKSNEEKRKVILNVIRYGDEDSNRGLEKIRVASALVERFAPNGRALAVSMENAIREDYEKIPAEIISDFVMSHLKNEGLFRLAKSLEFEAFRTSLQGFDSLTIEEKSFLGVLMDFSNIDREKFANYWISKSPPLNAEKISSTSNEIRTGSLFD